MTRSRLAVILLVILALTGCSGSSQSSAEADAALAKAADKLDSTSGVELTMSGTLPAGINGMTSVQGTATKSPAFQGKIGITLSSLPVSVDVIAADSKVYAVLPFTTGYSPIDPSTYGAPDPAKFLDSSYGVPAWLRALADGSHTSKQVREGSDVLTEYSGTVSGTVVTGLLPSADASESFDVTARVTADGTMTTMDVTGPFYKGSAAMTYEVDITAYDVQKSISAP